MEVLERSKLSYWETRTINIGNYEKRESGLSISHSIIEPAQGVGNRMMQVSESASSSIDIDNSDIKHINKVSNYLINIVQKKLDAIERDVRSRTANWEGVDFDSEKKGVVFGSIKEEDYTGKHKRRHELTDEDLDI